MIGDETEIYQQVNELHEKASKLYAEAKELYAERDRILWEYHKATGAMRCYGEDDRFFFEIEFNPKIQGPIFDKRGKPK